MLNWYIEEAAMRQREMLNEAQQQRRWNEAMAGARQLGLQSKVARRIGSWMIEAGKRLQGQDNLPTVTPQIVVLAAPLGMGEMSKNR